MVETILESPIVDAIGWSLVQFAWQGTIVAAVTAVALLALSKADARIRYALACLGMLVMVALPTGTAITTYKATAGAEPPDRTDPVAATTWIELEAPAEALVLPTVPERAEPVWTRVDLESWLPAIVLTWFAGVLALSLRTVGGWVLVRRMQRRGRLADIRVLDLVRRTAASLGLSRRVRTLESALVHVPTAVGWLRPVVLLPASALAGLSPEQLHAVIAHELAHIRRQDYLINLFQTLAETLLFYHPAIWWLSNRIRAEREHAADDLAVAACGDALLYAQALSKLEAARPGVALALGATGGSLLARIQRVLGQPVRRNRPTAAGLAVAGMLAALLFALGGGEATAVTAPALQEVPGTATEPVESVPEPEIAPAPEPPSLPDSPETAAPEVRETLELTPEIDEDGNVSIRFSGGISGIGSSFMGLSYPVAQETEGRNEILRFSNGLNLAAERQEAEAEAALERQQSALERQLRQQNELRERAAALSASEAVRARLEAEAQAPVIRSIVSGGFLGLGIEDGPDRGATVSSVSPEGPASEAGIQEGDLITGYNGTPVVGAAQFTRLVSETPSGRTVPVTLERNGQEQTVEVTLAARNRTVQRLDVLNDEVIRMNDRIATIAGNNVFFSRNGARALGLQADTMTPALREFFGADPAAGVLVVSIDDDSIGGNAGLLVGDVIVAIDGNRVDSASDVGNLSRAVLATGNSVTVTILRDRSELEIVVEPDGN